MTNYIQQQVIWLVGAILINLHSHTATHDQIIHEIILSVYSFMGGKKCIKFSFRLGPDTQFSAKGLK